MLIPLGLVFWYSLHEWNVLANTFTYTGAQNYRMLIEDGNLLEVLGATGIFSAGLVVFNLSLALLLAVLLNQKLAGIAIFRTLFFSPVVVSLVARTIVWGFLLQKNGGINGMLLMVGIEGPNWLREETTAMISVIVVQVFKNVGLNMILFPGGTSGRAEGTLRGRPHRRRASLQTVPSHHPAADQPDDPVDLDHHHCRLVTGFAQIAVLTRGGPGLSTTVLVYYLYQQAFQFHFFGYGSTLSILLFLIVAVLTFAQWQMRKRIVFYES